MKGILAALVGAAAVLATGSASAATVTLDETIDLTKSFVPGAHTWITGFAGSPDAWSSPFDFSINPGDTLDLRVMFLPGQSLTTGPYSDIQLVFESNTGTLRLVGNTTETLTFLDADGNSGLTATSTYNNPGNIVSNFLAQTLPAGTPPISYYGFEYKVTILTATDVNFGQPPGYETSEFNAASFAMFDNPNAIPEPATWAMMVAGMFGLGAALRWRRSEAWAA